MADNRLTSKRIKNHLTYSWWKYLLCTVLCVMGVDLLFAVTAYRPPADKQIELYLCNGYADALTLEETLWPELLARYPEQEELAVLNIDLTAGDIYAPMQFAAYVAAQQGDVCLLPENEVQRMAGDDMASVFVNLTPYIESGVIDVSGLGDAQDVLVPAADGTGVYAIAVDALQGLGAYGCDPSGGMLCVMNYGGNLDTAAGMVGMLIELFLP